MTKTVNIPLSKETCHTVKWSVIWFLWIGATTGMLYATYYIATTPTWGLIPAPIAGSGFSIICMIVYLRNNNHWIEFKCNCDEPTSDESTNGIRAGTGSIRMF